MLDGEGVAIEQRFLELDRATLSVDRLAGELARYAELHRLSGADGELLWRERYPVFPPVHCVLTGGRRSVLERRRATTIAMLRTDPRFTREPEVAVSTACSKTWNAKARSPRSSATQATRPSRSTGLVVIPTRKRDHGKQGERRSIRESKSARIHRAESADRLRQCPIEDLEPVFEIESPEPGSALDEQLRREQAKAILDLPIAYKRRHPD